MDINQITYFLNLSETLNFTEAAGLSGVSQPSLTKSIRRLEEELGGTVLYRDGKDTRLTTLGRDIEIEFLSIWTKIEKVRNLAENAALGRERILSIGVATTITPRLFSTFWDSVLKQMPSVEIHVHPMQSGENEAQILSGKYDICIMTTPPQSNFKLTIQPLYEEEVGMAVSTDHPFAELAIIKEDQLRHEPYIDRLHCEFRSQLVMHFMDRDIVMNPRFQSEREDWVQHMIARNTGIGVLPMKSAIMDGIVVKPVEKMKLSRQVTMVAISGSGNPEEVRKILKLAGTHHWV